MNKLVCFSENQSDVKIAFADYLNQYLSDVEHRDGYTYDKSISFSEKETKVNALALLMLLLWLTTLWLSGLTLQL